MRWLENPGRGPSLNNHWKNHTVGLQDARPMFLGVADINCDGRKDILAPTMYHGFVVFLRIYNSWERVDVPFPEITGARGKSVAVGDIDGGGSPDVVTSHEEAEGKAGIIWTSFENRTNRKHHNASGPAGVKFDLVQLIDIDQDGDLDILTSEENNNSIEVPGLGVIWYENPSKLECL